MTRTVTIENLPPTVEGLFSEHVAHPEYVGVSCDECGEPGYAHEHDADDADSGDAVLVCGECA